jgi:O-antigen ligase
VKWAALSLCLAFIFPLAAWLRANPRLRPQFWMALGFLPFVVGYFHLYMAIYSTPLWGGYVKGAEFSVLDALAVILYISLPRGQRFSVPFRLSMALYFVATLLSAFQAPFPTESLLLPWQLARMFLVYATVARGCADAEATSALMKGMGAAVILETGLTLWQRFGLHMIQTGGTMGHQNLLGLMSHLVILPFFALVLAGPRGQFAAAVVMAGAVTSISTASRGTIGILGLGLFAVFVLSGAGRWTSRKQRVLLVSALLMVVILPAAVMSLDTRFGARPLDEDVYDERGAYKEAAAAMLSDNPMGVGANSFAVVGNMKGYFDLGDVAAVSSSRSGNVHNIYYLAAAEAGYLGLIALLILFLRPAVVAFRAWWRNRADDRGNLLLGFGAALVAVYLHSWYEWSLATFSAEYLLAMIIGLVAANARALGYWQVKRSSAAYPAKRLLNADPVPEAISARGLGPRFRALAHSRPSARQGV